MLPKKSLLFSVAPLPAKVLLLLPSAFHANEGTTGIRRLFLDNGLETCLSFENRAGIFDIDSPAWAASCATAAQAVARGEFDATAAPDPETLFALLFTSGSTGAPKAVRMTQGRAADASPTGGGGPP